MAQLPEGVTVARSFGRAAASYDEVNQVQRLAADRLLERLVHHVMVRQGVLGQGCALDVGCATAPTAADLHRTFPALRFLGVDIALPMLQQAVRLERCLPHYQLLCAHACGLPFAEHTVDLVFSSFALQWVEPAAALSELRRVMKEGALLALSMPVAGSLVEIRDSWHEVDGTSHVNELLDASGWLAQAQAAGFEVCDSAVWDRVEYAPDAMAHLRRIKASGAQQHQQMSAGLASRHKLNRFLTNYERHRNGQGLPLTWRVLEVVLLAVSNN